MLRKVGLRRTPMKPWRRKADDKVPPEEGNYVAARDLNVGGCVMAHLDRYHLCHDAFGNRIAPDAQYELDHIDNAGVGNRGVSTRYNLVRLCPYAHRVKTENARVWRMELRAYIGRVERDAAA
jgi:hypothetical protein